MVDASWSMAGSGQFTLGVSACGSVALMKLLVRASTPRKRTFVAPQRADHSPRLAQCFLSVPGALVMSP